MAKKNGNRKNTLWEAGAEAFVHLNLDVPHYGYVCPLCVRLFRKSEIDLLSIDHVPPKSVGGKKLMLTCRDCNSHAGHSIENHLANLQKIQDFNSGKCFLPQKLTTDKVKDLNVEVRMSRDGVRVAALPQNNPPGKTKLWGQELEHRYQTGQGIPDLQLAISLPRADPQKVAIAWLKAGFLAAFSVFGYRYALSRELKLVRDQIRHPEKKLITAFGQPFDNADISAREIVVVTEPDWLKGIAVQIGSCLVFLPYTESADTFFAKLAMQSGRKAEIKGFSYGWPSKPQFLWDKCNFKRPYDA